MANHDHPVKEYSFALKDLFDGKVDFSLVQYPGRDGLETCPNERPVGNALLRSCGLPGRQNTDA